MGTDSICPRPEKLRYKTKAIAVEVCAINGWDGQWPYRCVCGWYHTYSKRKK